MVMARPLCFHDLGCGGGILRSIRYISKEKRAGGHNDSIPYMSHRCVAEPYSNQAIG